MSEEPTLDVFTEKENDSNEVKSESSLDPKVLTGVLEDWQRTSLETVADDRENSFVDGPFGANLLSEEFYDEGFARTIKLQNIRSGEFIDTNRNYITRDKFQDLERHAAYPNEIAIAKMAEPVARACILPEFEDQYILAAADCVKLDSSSDFSNRFVMYSLNSYPVWKQAFSRARGTGRKRINLNQLKEVKIPTPPLEEQRKIATVLYTVDQAIQKTEEIIKQGKIVRKAVAQDLLSAGTRDTETKETRTRFGPLPRTWAIKQLNEVTEIIGGSTPSTDDSDYWDGTIPWATPTDLTELTGLEITETEDYITESGLESASTHLLPPESVLITSRASIGKCAVNVVEMATNQGFQSLVPSQEVNTWYLYYRMKNEAPYLDSLGSGSTFSEVSKRTMGKIDIPVPPIEEQREIGKVLQEVDDRIIHERSYNDRLKRLKEGLMQDLLSGTVRAHEVDIDIPDEVLAHG